MEPSLPHSDPRRVPVVDDGADAADALAMLVRAWGQDVRVVYGGEEGFQAALKFGPEVCLLDLGMPGTGGLDLAARLRREPATAGAVLAAVCGWGDPETRRRTREALDFPLLKPSKTEMLRAVLEGRAPARR